MNVVLSFDDGRIDNYKNAFPVLKKYGLTASIHITTGFIDGTFVTDEFGKNMEPLTIQSLEDMSRIGIDISSHGDKHIMEKKDFLISREKIKSWIGKSVVGFSVPNSSASKENVNSFVDNVKNSVSYVRIGRDSRCKSFIYKFFYLIYKIAHFQLCFNLFNKININTVFDKYYIKSVVIKRHTKSRNVINFIKKYSSIDGALVLMLHTVTDKPQNPWEWSLAQFENLCSYLKNMSDSKQIILTNLQKLVEEKDEQ